MIGLSDRESAPTLAACSSSDVIRLGVTRQGNPHIKTRPRAAWLLKGVLQVDGPAHLDSATCVRFQPYSFETPHVSIYYLLYELISSYFKHAFLFCTRLFLKTATVVSDKWVMFRMAGWMLTRSNVD